MKSNHRKYDPKFKAEIILDLLSNRQTLTEVAQKHQLHHSVILRWKKEFLENAYQIFEKKPDEAAKQNEVLIESLYQTIGKRDIELEWMKKKVGYFSQ